jgi:hypothetical protein
MAAYLMALTRARRLGRNLLTEKYVTAETAKKINELIEAGDFLRNRRGPGDGIRLTSAAMLDVMINRQLFHSSLQL